ncbi:MAG: inositol monophosphatase family protein [Hyphomicrobiaceae bacterium]|nr:inositol monophosphatase [Hyphomicrobiaceae bacterium]
MAASPLMTVMMGAARKAGRSLTRDFGEVEQLQVSIKGPANFVSAADHRSEDIVFQELSKARPGYGFLMEERGSVEGADKTHRWIVDPLDGTTNFLHGMPLFAVAIGLEREGQIIAGLVYSPVMEEMFMAEKGKGAFYTDKTGRDRRLRVSARKSLDDCLMTTGIPHRGRGHHDRFHREAGHMMKSVAGLRRTGSACLDLAWTAAGRFDGYWEHNLGAWDIAAGAIIVREAGGIVTDFDGGANMLDVGEVCAGNQTVQRMMIDELKKARGE